MYQPVPADCTPDHIESDLMDLGSVGVADLRRLSVPDGAARLLAELRRARTNAMGGPEPGRAE
ncbi:aldo/keto reductase [Streptomyces sp. NBC_00059]|uniref:aldo/keto reductase n=1 Tax=Streptomyces sp. NBC_00059 TaxID=2975635 RepID=UPI002250364D|nr:aldo/keto reductase [Streptomyces sp. NBC_00059]MCX5415336.1 aldo/keto reductase [Streptomyces sp. NBC_00059]